MELKIMMFDIVVNSQINSPELVNYDNLGLYKKKITSKGLLDGCEYYSEFDGKVYNNLIISVSFVYHFDGVIYTDYDTTVNWIDTDDNIGYTKLFNKILMPWEIIDFGVDKRNNIVSTAKLYALGELGYSNGTDLLFTLESPVNAYIQGVPPVLLTTEVNNLVGTKPYLTQPISDGINSILSDI